MDRALKGRGGGCLPAPEKALSCGRKIHLSGNAEAGCSGKRPLCGPPFFYPEMNGNFSLPRQIEMPNGSGDQILQTDHVPTGRNPSSGAHVGPRAEMKGIDRPLAL